MGRNPGRTALLACGAAVAVTSFCVIGGTGVAAHAGTLGGDADGVAASPVAFSYAGGGTVTVGMPFGQVPAGAASVSDLSWQTRIARGASRDAARAAVAQAPGTPRELARSLAADAGWSGQQWSCLDELWQHESRYLTKATNPRSGAYGIPQALPASKMASAGADWRVNPATQIRWGLSYIKDRYATPCAAWSYWQKHGSY